MIDLVLASKKVWSQLKKEVIRDAAAKRITSRDDYKVFYEIAENVSNRFDWACVSPLPSPRTMHRGLLTLVLVLGHLTDSSGRVYELVVELGKAADARSDDAVRDWLRNASSWKSVKRENDIEVIQYLTWKLAESFRKLRPK